MTTTSERQPDGNNHDVAVIARETGISPRQISATLGLLADGATIPFISRYRKEATGGLDEIAIFNISTRAEELSGMAKRKEYILSTIDAQNSLTDELRERIENCTDAAALEDIYLPFKPKRRTRAQIARENGLEPLAKIIMAQRDGALGRASSFISEKVPSADDALNGASDIIAEWVNESEEARARVRDQFRRFATISSKAVKAKIDDAANYETYFDFSVPLARCSSHNYLAMRRGETEGMLRVSIDVDDERTLNRLIPLFVRRHAPADVADFISDAVADGYKRLTRPAIENEMAAEAKVKADTTAIDTFSNNLRQLLLAPPLGSKRILAIDPGFRTGCKVVCLDANGNLLHNDVIYPTPPKSDITGAARKISYLVEAYKIDAISLGNGTASRETERFLKNMRYPRPVDVFVVSENGASVYSASKTARDEFPDYDVTVRGAVSIGRRLMDPLAELVKIDPKAIGVGQYQHDVDQSRLKASLDMTVMSCVNSVGVDVNTASRQLLAYVSGIGDTLAGNIVAYRAENGDFPSRDALKKVPRMGPKAFEQCAGFLRVPTGADILDHTAVHPERYPLVRQMASDLGLSIQEIVSNPEILKKIDLNRYVDENTGLSTLSDIILELEKPGRDPRQKATVMEFDDSVNDITDLKPGMVLPGIINNITDFGAFVDLGVHKSGLIHISQISDKRIANPSQVLRLHQQVKVKVLEVDLKRGRIALTLRDVE
jgi:uncharacterized protein